VAETGPPGAYDKWGLFDAARTPWSSGTFNCNLIHILIDGILVILDSFMA